MHRSAEPSPLHSCMTHAHVDLQLAYLSVYASSISGVLNYILPYYTYPAPEVLQFLPSQCMIYARGKAPVYVTVKLYYECLCDYNT